ncbi:hypothetical protein SSPIM334S_01878 [Streptomyces spiroverticillatus]
MRSALLDQELDAGVGVVEGAQDVREQARAQARGRAQADPAPAQLGQLLDLAAGGVGVGEDTAGEGEEGPAGVGEGDVAPGPGEEVGPQLALQGADLLGQRGLRDVQLLGGAGEVPGLGHGHEIAELLELHADQSRWIDRKRLWR